MGLSFSEKEKIMNTTSLVLIIIGVVLLVVIAALWSTYNGLVKLNERVNEAWSDITVQLKYRADLIPNVVETVKGYAKHEKEVFNTITSIRSNSYDGMTTDNKININEKLTNEISKVIAVSENYPDLKASENFSQLSKYLTKIEDEIANSRKYYNLLKTFLIQEVIQIYSSN